MKKTFGQIAFEAHKEARTDWIGQIDWDHQCEANRNAFEAVALAVLASQWRPVTEPPENKFEPVFMWSPDGATSRQFHGAHCSYVWWMPIPPLPPEPSDPYAELKAAHAAGKVIQWCDNGHWIDLSLGTDDPLLWFHPAKDYRIKPWTLSRHIPGFRALESGEEWHRNDFTEDMLPEGCRPLLMGESLVPNDEGDYGSDGTPMFCIFNGGNTKTFPQYRYRTRRPLPSTRAELERREFEEWALSEGIMRQSDTSSILISRVNAAWSAWQAARKQKEAK